jgi:leader peptidase (prepilin peptidase)/N-methyltransferase
MISGLVFVVGLFVGTFLNACIDALPHNKSINLFSSFCPSCKQPSALRERIPLLGYLLSGGKCTQCNASVSLRYPAIELIAALVCFFLFREYGFSFNFFLKTFFILLLVLVSLVDISSGVIPDMLSMGGLSVGLVLAFFRKPFFFYQDALYGLAFGGAFLAVAFCCQRFLNREVMGFGDAKLLCVIGAFCGLRGAVFALVAGSLLGMLIGIPIMVSQGKGVKNAIPFGPYLSLGALVFMFFGDRFVYAFLAYISGRSI